MAKGKIVKFRNFDEMLAERVQVAPTFQLFDKTYTLTPSLRYDAVLALQRLSRRKDDETVSEDDAFTTFELILGKENLDDLRAHDRFDVDLAADLVKWAMEQYGFAKEDESPKVKAEE